MSWSIEWSVPAIAALRAVHWKQAARIDRAVQRFAAWGEGDRFRFASDEPLTFRLRVHPHVVRMSLDKGPKIVRVWYIYRE
ncbi:MAG: hypothetical protein U0359_28600 [Byssovorax sp.]